MLRKGLHPDLKIKTSDKSKTVCHMFWALFLTLVLLSVQVGTVLMSF